MEKTSKEDHINLVHALIAASNAFHNTLKKHGYVVSYGLDNSKTGSIKKLDVQDRDNWALGDLSIAWKLNKRTR